MNKNNKKIISKIILAIGIILRFIAFLFASPNVNQHDVLYRYGHFDYAMYLFKYGSLPPMGGATFSHPPINAFLQSLVMRFLSLFKDYSANYLELYGHTKILSFIYSVLTLIIIYKILNEFDILDALKNIILFIMAVYPGLIIMTTQYSNDNISYMFFYLSLYLAIKWCKNKDLKTIILLALSIGIGMLTKVSVGLIAFIIGPMMFIIWVRSLKVAHEVRNYGVGENKAVGADSIRPYIEVSPSITKQLIIFALIVFPIGLSYSIRNLVRFNIPIGAISEIAEGSILDLRKYSHDFVDRFLSFPLDRVIRRKDSIYHVETEYNVWIDLVKTATFDEFNYRKTAFHPFLFVLYIINIVFHFIGFVAVILNIVDIIKNIRSFGAKIRDSYTNLLIIGIMLVFLAIFAYVGFNLKYPYSCNSNYRYVAYITFGLAINMAIKGLQIVKK